MPAAAMTAAASAASATRVVAEMPMIRGGIGFPAEARAFACISAGLFLDISWLLFLQHVEVIRVLDAIKYVQENPDEALRCSRSSMPEKSHV